MSRRPLHKNAMYIKDTKMYLKGKTKAELAKLRKIHLSTANQRISQTLFKLIGYYSLKDYPRIPNVRGAGKLKNARENADFWLKLISDYQKGVKPVIIEPQPIVEETKQVEIKKEPEPIPERPKRIKLAEILAMS